MPAIDSLRIVAFVEFSFFASSNPAVTPSNTPMRAVIPRPTKGKNFAPLSKPLPRFFIPFSLPVSFLANLPVFLSLVFPSLSVLTSEPNFIRPVPARAAALVNVFTPNIKPLNINPGANKVAIPANPTTKPSGFFTSNMFLKFSQVGSLKNLPIPKAKGFSVFL